MTNRNAFFIHPENLLLLMVMDDRQHIRELTLWLVLKSKETPTKEKIVRHFLVSAKNFDANDYYDTIIDLKLRLHIHFFW